MIWTAERIRKDYGFDVVGVVKQDAKSIIILCLETSPERDLDEFIGGNAVYKTWCFSGFKKYFSPKVDEFLEEFEKDDPRAVPIAGYDDTIRLKKLAVKASIGIQGRNTLVINHEFQGRLRFCAVETFLDIEPTGDGIYHHANNRHCDKCRLCERACPVEAFKDYKLIDEEECLAHRQLTDRTPNLERCNLCWIACTKDRSWAEKMRSEREEIIRKFLPKDANPLH
ncbi:MAG: hypothetical protein HQ551_05050 [Desulfobacteraceae bacterium]|nr:hypothetical protein [Desulfobacteraceae bacterium]